MNLADKNQQQVLRQQARDRLTRFCGMRVAVFTLLSAVCAKPVSPASLPAQAAYAVATWLGRGGSTCSFATARWHDGRPQQPDVPLSEPAPCWIPANSPGDPASGLSAAGVQGRDNGGLLVSFHPQATRQERVAAVRRFGLGDLLSRTEAVYLLEAVQDNEGSEFHRRGLITLAPSPPAAALGLTTHRRMRQHG